MTKNYSIRKATLHDVAAISAIHAAAWQETYHGLLPEKVLNNFSQEKCQLLWNEVVRASEPHSACFIAELDSEMLGFIHCGECKKEKGTGEYFALYVLERAQRLGIGSALFQEATQFLDPHFQKKMLWVLKENRAARLFYEKQNGVALGSALFQLGEVAVEKVRYNWNE